MITAEVEPLGGFIGDAFAVPALQGGLLLTAIFYIFSQDLIMGVASILLYPIQGYIIPRLQKRVNMLGKALFHVSQARIVSFETSRRGSEQIPSR